MFWEMLYNDFMQNLENKIKNEKILLLSCCAPCSIGVIERFKNEGRDFAVLFYNPNIQPFAEYEKRLNENKRLCVDMGVDFFELPYEPEKWKAVTVGLENEPEKGRRCDKCFALRLKRAALFAKEMGFSKFTSVLGVSRYKNFEQVTSIALQIAQEENISYDETNWRKNGGEDRRAYLAKEWKLYHQTYCGCKPR